MSRHVAFRYVMVALKVWAHSPGPLRVGRVAASCCERGLWPGTATHAAWAGRTVMFIPRFRGTYMNAYLLC